MVNPSNVTLLETREIQLRIREERVAHRLVMTKIAVLWPPEITAVSSSPSMAIASDVKLSAESTVCSPEKTTLDEAL
jgi:hypothetical protein